MAEAVLEGKSILNKTVVETSEKEAIEEKIATEEKEEKEEVTG